MMMQPNLLAVVSGLGLLFANHANALDTTTVKTSNGIIKGFTDKSFPNVAQFLGIPYAEPPIGNRRWAPAVAKGRFGTLDASSQSPACPQSEPATTGAWKPEFLIKPNSTSEDCLYVDIWAPFKTGPAKQGKLPVLVWIYGGGFVAGGSDIDYQIPSQWVSRSQKHIVVSFNYRVGVFGFPNAPGIDLKKQNLGLLDQRLAIEWVRDNISRFGGDPKRITLWGQSAGAASVGYYQYAYPEDPIARAFIQNSGGVYLGIASTDASHSNFTSIAKKFKCDKGNQVDCLRKVPFKDIQQYSDKSGFGDSAFVPLVDEKTRFSDYYKRILSPKVAKFPNIIGTNRDEGSFGGEQAKSSESAPTDQVKPDSLFTCPAHFETAVRSAANAKTWRYLYSGNFTNIMPGKEGAYHSAELPLIFGTHGIARGKSTPFEVEVSHSMQDHWLAFIQDPVSGLDKLGWKPTSSGGLDTLQTGVEFGFKNEVLRNTMAGNLVVLGDAEIRDLLICLSKDEVLEFKRALEKVLIDFSVRSEDKYQPTPDFVNRDNGQKTLFRAFTSPDYVGTKIVVTPAPIQDADGNSVNRPLGGLLSLCDSAGVPTGILNAAEPTGYRTTLSALIPWTWRRNTENIVIFGAGKQGLWHTRLALALRGSEIKKITIVNRSVGRARDLVKRVTDENQKYWKSSATLDVLDPTQSDYEQALASLLSSADAVFCTVGSTSPLFSLKTILGDGTRSRLPFVGAIGSWQADMIELDPEMLRHAASRDDSFSRSGTQGSIIVDDLKEALVKSGEVVQSGLGADSLIQVGEILDWLDEKSLRKPDAGIEKLMNWISEGFIVYKGIGVSVTDLAAGNAILELARKRNVGTTVSNF
ncbi:hypothetical protein F53441_7609 [Fusarium austroafricanum]|uniref:Carboxylesterase type B domain-containing protein n=1 Tax=Fusarium austroafricanum TaxID=2364996 RepID=A0A8H4KD34_9HYPO|nr:hypothetical protein F53441_7609 [Fusarium austroafricanum]